MQILTEATPKMRRESLPLTVKAPKLAGALSVFSVYLSHVTKF